MTERAHPGIGMLLCEGGGVFVLWEYAMYAWFGGVVLRYAAGEQRSVASILKVRV